MPGPLEMLKHEHRIIERILKALDGICVRLDRGEQVPPDALSACLDFIRTFADACHHGKEEAHLFPALEEHGVPRLGGPVGAMLHEHELGRGFVAELDRAIQAYRVGSPEAGRRIVETARQYIELLTQHIHKEDYVLFNIAETILDDGALASLRDRFEQAEAALGVGTHEQYERIAAELERAWAV